jgi:integrase
MRTLCEDDIQTILSEAKSTPYYSLFYLALFTGMRRSELLALRWADVDLIMAEISVNRSMHRLQDGQTIFKSPKTDKARRTISLSPSTCHVLREHQDAQIDFRSRLGISLTDSDLVFSQADGSPLIPHSVTQAWRRLVTKLGLKGVRLHDLRHTHASLMLKQGVHPKIVQERLGHSSIQVTLDTYSHVTPGLQRVAAQRFDDIFNGWVSKRLAKTENTVTSD